MTYPGGTSSQAGEVLTFSYHPQKALDSFTSSLADYLQSTSYDEAGRVVSRSLGTNPVTNTAFTYYAWDAASPGNSLGRLWKMESGPSGSPNSLQNLSYQYDAVGNITQIDDNRTGITMTQSFTYDDLNRLLSATASGDDTGNRNYSESYSYDAEGRLSTKGGVTLTYNDAAHVHAVSAMGGNTYSHDANGNQTQRVLGSDTYDLAYDAEGRLVEVKKNTVVFANFVYDGVGRRVKSTVDGQTSAYVGGHYEYDVTNTTTRSYYGGVAMRVDDGTNNDVYWQLRDHLGSTSITLNDTGGTHAELFYTAFGESRYSSGTTPTDIRFTGQREESDIGMYFYNARWYDPALGRFVQADTIVQSSGSSQAYDRYSYVLNNPQKYVDPSGHCFADINSQDCYPRDEFKPPRIDIELSDTELAGIKSRAENSSWYAGRGGYFDRAIAVYRELRNIVNNSQEPVWFDFNGDGLFTLEEFFELVLLIEVYSVNSLEFVDYVIEASYNHPMVDWQSENVQQGATLYEVLFTYIGSRQGVVGAAGYRKNNLLENYSHLYDRIHTTLRLPDAGELDTFVYTNDMVIDFGNRSLFPRPGLDEASVGSAYNQYLAVFGIGDSAYVMTICQSDYWKGNDVAARCLP